MKYFILIGLILASLAYGAQGLEVTISQGNGESESQLFMDYEAGFEDIVSQNIEINPEDCTSSNHLYFEGPGSTSRRAYGSKGGYAGSGFSIKGSKARTWYEFTSSTKPSASVSESLTSQQANDIYAYGIASSNRGDLAKGYIDVYSPANNAELKDYWNNALASYSSAQVKQGASHASAISVYGSIVMDMYAYNSRDTSGVDAKLTYYPILYTYPLYNSLTATAYANKDAGQTDAYQSFYGYGWPSKKNTISLKEYTIKGSSVQSRTDYYTGWQRLSQKAWTRANSRGISN